ncbi:MAG: hypothetical protein HPY50_11275 [Firmicutes bacterium]|nr:hypothetical protein [Bacillota bacterium]
MRITALILIVLLLLPGCSAGGNPDGQPTGSSAPGVGAETEIFTPDHQLSMEETIENFFSLQYDIYTGMRYFDISCLIDTSQQRLVNELVWLQTLTLRRRLIAENGFCYVETQRYPYTIRFDEQAEDERLEFWSRHGMKTEGSMVVNFTITGEAGRAYPPFLAVNSQHTMFLKQENGVWKITFHYYSGASRFRNKTLVVPGEGEMLAGLRDEFKNVSEPDLERASVPPGTAAYDGTRAVEYAMRHAESANPIFYDAGDWRGNCANFTSQCIWAGFGGRGETDVSGQRFMTSRWYAGEGGGSSAWENVVSFWNYAANPPRSGGLNGTVAAGISQLKPGGIIQTRLPGEGEEFGHSLLLVNPSTLMLAQNSPDNFVYYSDLVSSEMRFYNPAYLVE